MLGGSVVTVPACHNRAPRPTHYVVNKWVSMSGNQIRTRVPSAFVDRCATWDGRGIGPNGEPYPIAHGWDCTGCRWLPEGVL